MYTLLFMIGALIPTYLISRLFLYLVKKFLRKNGYLAANFLSLLTIGGFYGLSQWNMNGGNYPMWLAWGVGTYALPQLVWLGKDIYEAKRGGNQKGAK